MTIQQENPTFTIQQENPKRPGSKSHGRYEKYKSATSLEELLDLGGTKGDYNHDLKKGYIVLKDAKKRSADEENVGPRKKKTKGFEVSFAVKARITEWDDETFVDCRPSEAQDSQDQHIDAVKRLEDQGHVSTHATLEEAVAAAKVSLDGWMNDLTDDIKNSGDFEFDKDYEDTENNIASEKTDKGITTITSLAIPFEVDVFGADLHNLAEVKVILLIKPAK